jgi:HSP20 family molecular chaperone IbpA
MENVDAQYANGVLTLHLKKVAPATTKRVEVKVK